MQKRQIYLLSPKKLSPEIIAVAFAKTSRSPESFQKIADELSDESSAKFNEKWVVGYGHASVAEHAVLHIAIENVSRLAVECIESNRLASYTEKSTRYQRWGPDDYFVQLTLPTVEEAVSTNYQKLGPDDFFIPPELENHKKLRESYFNTCNLLFDTYRRSLNSVKAWVEKQNPCRLDESEAGYNNRIRSQYVDSCRFLLPAASLANLGLTANARVLEHAISKMLSHPLAEVRQVGEEVKCVAQAEVPTLVKYAQEIPYLVETAKELTQSALSSQPGTNHEAAGIGPEWCRLIDFDPDGETRVLAAALYRFGAMSFSQAVEQLHNMDPEARVDLANSLLGHMDEHDTPMRELEHTAYTFELLLDQGGYAELKRHRMMTQTPQALTAYLGYAVPRRIVEAGFKAPFCGAMEAAAETYAKLAGWNPAIASYIVPNGFNRRVLFTVNLREAFVFCQLRSAANAHFSMRRVAECMAEQIRHVHPLLAKYMHLPTENWQAVEDQYFFKP